MKVSELLDDIFFGKGDKKFLPLIKHFAGNDYAEIFGINDDYALDDTRVLITMPVDEELDDKKRLYDLYLANISGNFEHVGSNAISYYRDEIMGLYSLIMADDMMKNAASGYNLKNCANTLYQFMQNNVQRLNNPEQKQQ